MGNHYASGVKGNIHVELARPWWWDLIVGPPSSDQIHLYVQTLCERYPWLCQDTLPVDWDKFPPDPRELTTLVTVAGLIGIDGYPNPDGTGPDPDGPIGPIMHDLLVSLVAGQLAMGMADRELATNLQMVAGKTAQFSARRLQEVSG
ncbi:MAG: hypothetical protein R2848_12010 [Thermomicrobiales bacterium]